jgi:REP element-mobilizing transposase RayT
VVEQRYHRKSSEENVASRKDASPDVMPSTYLSLHFHLVFSTKSREATIAPKWRSRLHDYLGGTVRGLGGYSDRVGGVADHVHLLAGLKATHRLADFMRELKRHPRRGCMKSLGCARLHGKKAMRHSPSAPHRAKPCNNTSTVRRNIIA